LERARSLLRANGPALEELADALGRRGCVSFDGILGIVMTTGRNDTSPTLSVGQDPKP